MRAESSSTFYLCTQFTVFELHYKEQYCISMGNHLNAVTEVQLKAVPWQITTLSYESSARFCRKIQTSLCLLQLTLHPHQEVAPHLPAAFTISPYFKMQ